MNGYELVERIERGNLTDEEWFSLRDEVVEFLKNDPPEEEKALFVPLGHLEVISMICDGIDYENKTGRYAPKDDNK